RDRRLGHVLDRGEPRGIAAPVAGPSSRNHSSDGRQPPPSPWLLEGCRHVSVRGLGNDVAVVRLRAADTATRLRAELGRARPAPAASVPLLDLAESHHLEFVAGPIAAPRRAAATRGRWVSGPGGDTLA